jgi:beta-lactamase regulating signal transducer with metallopeptidase domain
MMPMLREIMVAVSNSLAASVVAKVTAVTALGLISAWFARGNRAAVRHALLAATFGVMLLLPIAAVLMPPLHVGVPVEVESRAPMLPPVIGVDTTASLTKVGAGARVTAGAARGLNLSLQNLLFVGWVAGVALFLLPVVAGLWQIRALRRSGSPWRHAQSLVKSLAHDAGIRRGVEVLLHEALPGPMTCGLVRPAIVLPQDAENWKREDLNRAIVHELEHIRRADSVTRCLARVACAIYWFHPLIWIAWRRLALEAERSCDDAVLRCSEATA